MGRYSVIALLIAAVFAYAPHVASQSLPNEQKLLADHLDRPQAVAPMSGNDALVAERTGKIVLVRRQTQTDIGEIEVPGAPILYIAQDGYTEGLKDLVAIPGTGRAFAWCMTTSSGAMVRWSVGRLELTEAPNNAVGMKNTLIWQSEPQPFSRGSMSSFAGCRMAVVDSDLIVAMGANDRRAGSGRIMRVPISSSRLPERLSTGHRNPGGIAVQDGTIWEIEFGPAGGDELNLIVKGGDYGWPRVSKGDPQEDGEPQRNGSFLKTRPGSIDPVVWWTPSINPSSLTLWRRHLLTGTLTGQIIDIAVDGKRVSTQRRMLQIDDRIRDVRPSSDGKSLFVLTDGPDARLFTISPN